MVIYLRVKLVLYIQSETLMCFVDTLDVAPGYSLALHKQIQCLLSLIHTSSMRKEPNCLGLVYAPRPQQGLTYF